MELRFLSAEMDGLIDPGPDAIRESLGQLSKSSGDNPPRAVLVHDNGKDFIQYVAKTKGEKVHNCHIQYCEHLGDGAGFRQYSAENKTIEQVIKLFQMYAAGDPKWQGRIGWEPMEHKLEWQVVVFGLVLALLGTWASYNFLIKGAGKAIVGALGSFGILGLLIYGAIKDRLDCNGMPWVEADALSSDSPGGGCSGGSCGGDGGGGGGGGGDGGGGGGGCGGGGGE